MYENEYKTLFAYIAPLCGGTGEIPKEPADPRTLCLLAKRHSVTNLLYHAIKDDPDFPPDLKTALETLLFISVRQQVAQEYEAKRLFAKLEEEEIRFLPMKGIVLRPLYPAPDMRISCDVDFFYDKAARPRMAALMESLGFTSSEEADANHEAFSKGPVSLEAHHNLMTHFKTVDAYYENIWDRLIPVSAYRYAMTDEDFYIYQLIHTMKHFTVGGTGIRSVLDVFVYLRAKPELDHAYLERELSGIGLLEFHRTFCTLAEVYFNGATLPPALQGVSDYILGSGTYGIMTQSVTNIASSGRGGKVGFYLRRAFPSYHLMAEKYPSLRRFPPALPFYWGRRLFTAAFGKEKKLQKEMNAVNAVDPKEKERLDGIMAQVGLRGYR